MASYTQPEPGGDHQCSSGERDAGEDRHPCPSNRVDIIGLWPRKHVGWCQINDIARHNEQKSDIGENCVSTAGRGLTGEV